MKFRNRLFLMTSLFLVVLLSSCASNSLLREATDATLSQSKVIETQLKQVDIELKSIELSQNAFVANLDEYWIAYDLKDTEDISYVLILRREGCVFTALLDANGKLLSGITDNTMFGS